MSLPEGVVGKLLAAGVVARRHDEFYFTDEFIEHLLDSNPEQYVKAGQLKGWRIILSYFSPALLSLSDVEVSKTVALFDYFRRNLENNKTPLVYRRKRHAME
ncbi:MAG TPA: hypothetical protein VH621_02550 [Nitrososphaera sp.]